ncbi:sensor histidine kinase [Bradyrhizobium japonicum]|uniref:sensor histidine kinase n=1 Tax=Bradyrhizobium japonicum TaxID=375 RepID=UPI001BAA134D|nr:ATP-binding protein [Bradyrhizobium japonicum]MBR0960060.1 sensor histidine kinase [Bradyrhizobium japonicum]
MVFGFTVLLLTMANEAMSEPRRVLFLHSYGRELGPWNDVARSVHDELIRQYPGPIDFFESSLATARDPDSDSVPFVEYLSTLFTNRKLDLVITNGAPAADFIRKYRQQLFPEIPALFTGLQHRRAPPDRPSASYAVVAFNNDFPLILEQMLRVLPETDRVVFILGSSPLERYWVDQLRTELKPFQERVTFEWLNDLSFEEMLKRCSALPARSAILFGLMSVDAAGVGHEERKAFDRLHAVANAPIFSYVDAYFGAGLVGGPLTQVNEIGRQAAGVAVRIFNGETPGEINSPPIEPAAPRYDWRELQRWKISERALPEGSEVYFRIPGMWEQYRSQLTAGIAALVLQAGIISLLLIERRRRQFAQTDASDRRREVVRLNRVTTANVLSTSLAHELNQPLGAILSNTEAAQMLLKANPPDLAQVDAILSDIVRDEQRVSEIILGLRNLLNNRTEGDLRPRDLNDTVRDVVKIVTPEITRRAMVLRTVLADEVLPVRCDPIHLQQVILNLVMNGIDAMEGAQPPHNLTIRTQRLGDTDVEVRITDTGKGISAGKLTSIFDAFVTTKPQGTGLGLPIAKTILESYGGDITAENRMRGAVFTFRLPLSGIGPTSELM